jgi:hypothetical protein
MAMEIQEMQDFKQLTHTARHTINFKMMQAITKIYVNFLLSSTRRPL